MLELDFFFVNSKNVTSVANISYFLSSSEFLLKCYCCPEIYVGLYLSNLRVCRISTSNLFHFGYGKYRSLHLFLEILHDIFCMEKQAAVNVHLSSTLFHLPSILKHIKIILLIYPINESSFPVY